MPGEENDETASKLPGVRFGQILSDLKRHGSTLLVVGSVPDSVYAQICRRMLGDPTVGPRYRLFVFTDDTTIPLDQRFPEKRPTRFPETARIIHYTTTSRSSAIQADSDHLTQQIPTITVENGELSTVRTIIEDAIEELETERDDFAPGTLRMCFDSLVPILDTHKEESIVRFLYHLAPVIKRVQGISHFHLPVAYESDTVTLLTPLFDAVVELRVKNGQPQERWHLQGADLTSEWLTR